MQGENFNTKHDIESSEEIKVKSERKSIHSPYLSKWNNTINKYIRKPIIKILLTLSTYSAKNPVKIVTIIPLLSVSFLIIGFSTNFKIEVDGDKLWTPQDTRRARDRRWAKSPEKNGFPPNNANYIAIIVHNHQLGEISPNKNVNVLTHEGVTKLFDAVETVKNTPGYENMCIPKLTKEEEEEGNGVVDLSSPCDLTCATNFWSSREEFEATIQDDDDIIDTLSSLVFVDGRPVHRPSIFGTSQTMNNTKHAENSLKDNITILGDDSDISKLTSAKSFLCHLKLPSTYDIEDDFDLNNGKQKLTYDFESSALE